MDVVFSYQLATIIYRGKLTIKLCEHTHGIRFVSSAALALTAILANVL